MFDDQSNQPEDIFAGVDGGGAPNNLPTAQPPQPAQVPSPPPVAPSQVPPQQAPAPAPAPSPVPPSNMGGSSRPPLPAPPRTGGGFKVFIIIIVAFLIIGLALFLAYTLVIQSPNENGVIGSIDEGGVIDQNTEDQQGTLPEEDPVPESELEPEPEAEEKDSDGDGLTDAQEAEYGTSPARIDSDKDGLGDKEEIMTYQTDPLDSDTDDDGFIDGDEVANGYDPNGPGRLFEVPQN